MLLSPSFSIFIIKCLYKEEIIGAPVIEIHHACHKRLIHNNNKPSFIIIIFLQKTSCSIILSWENDLMLIIMATYYYLDTYKLNVMKNME